MTDKNINMKTINKHLTRAIQENDATQVKVVLQYHKATLDLESCNLHGKTLLHESCQNGSLDIIRLLVDNGANLETKDNSGNTALHYASENGHIHVTRFLILNCANVNIKNKTGKLPVDLAKDKSLILLLEMAMSVKSTDITQSMTLGRLRRRRTHSSRCQQDNTDTLKKKVIRIEEENEENDKNKINDKPRFIAQKSFSFNKDRRNSWTGKLKKLDSFKKDSSRINKIRLKLLSRKQKHLNELRRVSSETDLGNLADFSREEEVKMQKVKNTDQINLIGLSIQ